MFHSKSIDFQVQAYDAKDRRNGFQMLRAMKKSLRRQQIGNNQETCTREKLQMFVQVQDLNVFASGFQPFPQLFGLGL